MRQVARWGVALLILGMAACASAPAETAAPGECCKKTAELKAQIPKCCAGPDAECCKASKMDPSKASECCKKAEEISAKLPECCKKAAAGQPQACCAK